MVPLVVVTVLLSRIPQDCKHVREAAYDGIFITAPAIRLNREGYRIGPAGCQIAGVTFPASDLLRGQGGHPMSAERPGRFA